MENNDKDVDEIFSDHKDFWNGKYSEREKFWSGKVNKTLEKYTKDIPAGNALELGCGEGGDAIWLAKQGWTVTACDVSDVALERARNEAKNQQVDDLISFEQYDLSQDFPTGDFDLVTAHFLRSPLTFDRESIFTKASKLVNKTGYLLIVDHSKAPPSMGDNHHHSFPSAKETYVSIGLDKTQWDTKYIGTFIRQTLTNDGQSLDWEDIVVYLKRR